MSYTDIIKKYNLDVSIVDLNEATNFNRFDGEFYLPEYIENDYKLNKKKSQNINTYLNDIRYGLNTEPYYVENGIKFLRALNLKEYGITGEILQIQLSKEKIGEINLLKQGDLLIVRSGANVGDLGIIINSNLDETTFGSYVIRLRIKKINPFFVYVFLKSKYGRYQTIRFRSGTAQPNISIPNLKSIKIPLPSTDLQNLLSKAVIKSYDTENQAKNLYQEAENIFLENLGLKNYKATDDNISVRELVECLKADRFDAEYWQPKYDELMRKIKKYKNGFDTLNNLINISNQKIKIDTDKFYNYIELADVDLGLGIVSNIQEIKGGDLPSRAKMKLQKNDVIVSSVEGSSNKVALIADDFNNLVGSTGFFVFREKYFKPEVMLVLIKSLFINELFKREAQGTILTAIPKPSLNRIILPKLTADIQSKISERIKNSHLLQTQSKELLEKAKRAVEIFIEKDEKEAIKFLKNN